MKRLLVVLAVVASCGIVRADFTMPGERTFHHTTQDIYAQPVGTLTAFNTSSCPRGYLEADGSAVSRSGYAKLFSVLGTRWGTGNTTTTFNIPDARGTFLRGYNHGSGNDPDAAARFALATGGSTGDTVATGETNQIASHRHTEEQPSNNTQCVSGSAVNVISNNNQNTSSTGGNQTAPANIDMIYCIFTGR